MATFTSVDHVKALEHPTLKVPYELLNKKFRMAQRTLDKEVQQVQSQVKELEKGVIESNTAGVDGDIPPPQSVATVGQISDLLTGVVEKLSQLKRKAKECILDELEAVNCCKRRLEHLKEHDKDSSGAGSASNSRQPQQIKNTRGLTQSKEDWNKKRFVLTGDLNSQLIGFVFPDSIECWSNTFFAVVTMTRPSNWPNSRMSNI